MRKVYTGRKAVIEGLSGYYGNVNLHFKTGFDRTRNADKAWEHVCEIGDDNTEMVVDGEVYDIYF